MQHSTAQYNATYTIHYTTIQYNTIQSSAILCPLHEMTGEQGVEIVNTSHNITVIVINFYWYQIT